MSALRKKIPKPLKRLVRRLRGYANDFSERRLYKERCLRGEDLWVEPVFRCRKSRLGRGDGEWFVNPDLLPPGSTVYSIGIGDNITFDIDLIELFGVEVHAFDPTPISRQWLETQELPAKFHFHPIGIANYDGVAEFQLPVSHGVSFTMLSGVPSGRTASCEVLRLATILERLGTARIDLFKLDIEGAEYDIIDDIVAHRDRIGQLLIEFHHRLLAGSDGMERTRNALSRLESAGFRLFHVSSRGIEFSFV